MTLLIDIIKTYIRETWYLTSEMAPYLLLGFVIAGLLRALFTEDWVRRHLGKRGLKQIFKAVAIGIPLPLCSCGVIPVAAGIRRQGGQRGAVAAFTASTPQTGVDSIAATVGMMGWPFAIIRIIIAFINGVAAGLTVERWGEKDAPANPDSGSGEKESGKSCCSGEGSDGTPEDKNFAEKLKSGLQFGLYTLPRDLFGALAIGLLVAGAISAFVPQDFFENIPGGLFSVYVAMTLVSLPLYVCSTGSIPLAFSFLQAGMSPGSVLIFLIAGPASNVATVTSLWKIIGGRSTLGYICSIVVTCWITAVIVDTTGLSILVMDSMHHHDTGISLFQHASAAVLILVLGWAKLRR